MPPAPGHKDFHIGLAMSGAISAGAYTAGVFDYLIQALDEWEKAVAGVDPDAVHSIGLKVLTGASAGAITAAIGALALADGERELHVFEDGAGQSFPYYLPKLYEAWVVRPTLVDETGGDNDLLSVSDLQTEPDPLLNRYLHSAGAPLPSAKGVNPVISLLNTRVLATIADAAIQPPQIPVAPRSYLANPLNVYMTLTNLRGIPYKVPFGLKGDEGRDGNYYYMISHADRVHYVIEGLGSWSGPEADSAFGLAGAKGKPLAAATLVAPVPDGWRDFSISALASGAFPIGLAPRVILADATADYDHRLFPINELITYESKITLNWPSSVSKDYFFTTVDGGTINNDPFEYAIFALKADKKLDQPLGENRSVIMISPFPEAKPIRAANHPRLDIVSIVSALFPSLIDQARFKPEALVLAAEDNERSAYLIGPSRVLSGKTTPERYGIASGLLGGFGGFVARAFRDHDFQLGRRNAQYFLKNFFTRPSDDSLFKDWSHDLAHASESFAEDAAAGKPYFRLIPICGSADPEVKLPKWPRISQAQFETLTTRISQRFDVLAPAFIEQNVAGVLQGVLRVLLAAPDWPNLPRQKILAFVRQTILADLVRRDQIEGWHLPKFLDLGVSDDVARLILGELLEPTYDLHSAKGILAAISPVLRPDDSPPDAKRIDARTVDWVLDRLKGVEGPAKVWEAPYKYGTERLFALDESKPGGLINFLGVSLNLSWFKPSADPEGRASFEDQRLSGRTG
jgi:hypothetical protein